jgi:hypothetical protein
MVGRRVRRGFRWLGAVVALPLLVVSAGAFALAGFAWFYARDLDPALDYIAIIQSSRGEIFIDPPCDIRDMFNSSRPICAAQGPSVLLRVTGVSTLIACVWYAACRSIGWVLARFAREDNVTVEPRN